MTRPVSMKRLIVFKTDLLPYSETFIREQAMALRSWSPVLVGYSRTPGLELAPLEHIVLQPPAASRSTKLIGKMRAMAWLADRSHVERLRSENASLVHAHFGHGAVAIYPVAQALGLPMVVTLHGQDISIAKERWERGEQGVVNRFYPRRLVEMGREGVRFVAVSEAIREMAVAFGLPRESVRVKYIGVDTSKFGGGGRRPIAEREPRVLFVGRLVEKKGGEYLIRAFTQVRREVPSAELTVIGDGPMRASLEALARSLGTPVRFTGALDSERVRQEMSQARVFCAPSIRAANGDSEGLGIVILEAEAMGLPVVTSADGGATEGIVDGVTGFAFVQKDHEQLGRRLVQLLVDNDLAASMSAQARAFVLERFDIGRCTRELEAYFDEVADTPTRPNPPMKHR